MPKLKLNPVFAFRTNASSNMMLFRKSVLCIFILLVVENVYAEDRNLMLWNLNVLEVNIDNKYSLGINEKLTFHTELGKINLKLADVYLKRNFNHWLNFGITGRNMWLRSEYDWRSEFHPMVFGNLSFRVNKFRIGLLNRIEYRMCKYDMNYLRHRHKLSVTTCPIESVSWLQLFFAEECLYRFNVNRVQMVRLHSGTGIKCSNNIDIKLYYVLEKNNSSQDWKTSDVLGLNLNINF